MTARYARRRQFAGLLGILALGALGTAMCVAASELSLASTAEDFDPSPRQRSFAAEFCGPSPAYGPPVPCGTRGYANDPMTERRAR